ncbi:spore maturation protein B [Candidatus Stoquefichus sp. SB1]|jgi:spore maturation protein B|uniref:spore maturation protein B n=1 Tax=Candidatus Stoquefichus sp. SB1 TaxID=1658109 RepID=UPI00067EAF0C|nr:spore maturation protein B [Candidatus Stoquefichus sp. SB1]
MNKVIIIFLLIVFIDGLIKKCHLFELFIDGVKDALTLIKPIFTTLMAFMLFVQLLRSSGCIDVLSALFQPIIQTLQIPIDIFVLGLLRPISANASLSFLYSFYEVFGVDHPLSLLATLIQSGSDTTMYVVALYFSSIQMKKTSYALWVGLLMDFLSVLFAITIYLKMFV